MYFTAGCSVSLFLQARVSYRISVRVSVSHLQVTSRRLTVLSLLTSALVTGGCVRNHRRRAANTSHLRSCGSATREAPRGAQLGVSPESSQRQWGRLGWEVLLGKMAETLEEVMFSPQQLMPSLPQRETLDTDSEPQVSTDTLTGARTPWQYPQKAALGLQAFRRSDAHLPMWLASVGNGDRGDVTAGEAAQAKAGLEPKLLREDEEWSSRGAHGTGRSPHCAKTSESRGRARWAREGWGRRPGASRSP